MSITFFRPPQIGENIIWLCLKCQKPFTAKNLGKAKCPHCGSRKTKRHPGIVY